MVKRKRTRTRRFTVECCECGKTFKAKKSNAMYCSNACRQKVRNKKRKIIKKIEIEGPKKINPYFLTRGNPLKNLSTGVSSMVGEIV